MSNLSAINARMAQLTQANTLAMQQLTLTVTAQARAASASMSQGTTQAMRGNLAAPASLGTALQHAVGALDHGLSEGVEKFGRIIERIDGAIGAVMERVQAAFSSVLESTGIAGAMRGLVSALDSKGVRTALEKIGQVVGVAAAPVMLLAKAAGEAAEGLKGAGKKALGWLDTVTALPTGKTSAGVQGAAAGGTALAGEAVKRSAGDLTGVFGALGGAASGVVGALTGIPNQLAQFVGAFSPSTMEAFNLVIRDTMAVFGIAFEPIIQAFTQLTREVGGVLLPVMEQIRPVIQEMASSFLERIIPVVELFARVMMDLMPVFQFFSDLMKALTPLVNALTVVFSGLMKGITTLLGGIFGGDSAKNAMDGFKRAIIEVSKFMMMLVAYIANLVGAKSIVQGMFDALNPGSTNKRDPTGTAAAQNAQYSAFSEYGRQLALAASTAKGKEDDKPKLEDHFGDIKALLKDQLEGGKALKDAFEAKMLLILSKMGGAIVSGVKSTAKSTFKNYTPFGWIGRKVGLLSEDKEE